MRAVIAKNSAIKPNSFMGGFMIAINAIKPTIVATIIPPMKRKKRGMDDERCRVIKGWMVGLLGGWMVWWFELWRLKFVLGILEIGIWDFIC